MGRLDTSRAAELRILAESLRRRAAEMTRADYADQMNRAAELVDAEADHLDGLRPPPKGRHFDIRI